MGLVTNLVGQEGCHNLFVEQINEKNVFFRVSLFNMIMDFHLMLIALPGALYAIVVSCIHMAGSHVFEGFSNIA